MMDLHLSDDEQQILKHVLHVLYKSFKLNKKTGVGTCSMLCVDPETLTGIIAIHDRIVDHELKADADCNESMKPALDYVRSQLQDYELEEIRAKVNSAYECHTTPTAYDDFDYVRDLLEEYGEENDLPEGWWENEGDLDDWLYEL